MNMLGDTAGPDLQPLFAGMQVAHRADPMPDRATRADRLLRLERALLAHETALVQAMQADFSDRGAEECRLFDITLPLGSIRKAHRDLRRLMRPRRVGAPLHLQPARAWRQPQPKGVAGIIAPWNFPVYLALSPVAAAIAAGNRVMLKPSELTPRTSEVLARMIHGAFGPDEFRVVLGGPDTGAAFAALPFDHLLFTGSTAVGRKVAVAAARNLTPVTLELGGKSPVVVAPDADLDRAADRIAFGKLANAGQACVAPDFALVPRDLAGALADRLAAAMVRMLPDGPADDGLTAIITPHHAARLAALVDEARSMGARVIQPLGADAPGRKLAPAILLDVPDGARILEEEIFGPLFPIRCYDSRDDAARMVADGDRPLVLYLFSRSAAERRFWQTQSLSGGMSVNETMLHFACDTLPIGGIGASGTGAYHGDAGFEAFSHLKSVFVQRRLNAAALVSLPDTPLKRRLRRVLRRMV